MYNWPNILNSLRKKLDCPHWRQSADLILHDDYVSSMFDVSFKRVMSKDAEFEAFAYNGARVSRTLTSYPKDARPDLITRLLDAMEAEFNALLEGDQALYNDWAFELYAQCNMSGLCRSLDVLNWASRVSSFDIHVGGATAPGTTDKQRFLRTHIHQELGTYTVLTDKWRLDGSFAFNGDDELVFAEPGDGFTRAKLTSIEDKQNARRLWLNSLAPSGASPKPILPLTDFEIQKLVDGMKATLNAAGAVPGRWTRGQTSHHVVCKTPGRQPYEIGEFHHADYAYAITDMFNSLPDIIRAIEQLKGDN